MITLHFDTLGLDEVKRLLSPKVFARASRSALNRSLTAAKKELINDVVAVYNMKKKDVNATMRTARAGRDRDYAAIYIRGKALSYRVFKARQTKRGVTYKFYRGGKRQLIPRAFIVGQGEKANVYVRVTYGKRMVPRLPIAVKRAIPITRMVEKEGVPKMINRVPELVDRFFVEYLKKKNLK